MILARAENKKVLKNTKQNANNAALATHAERQEEKKT